MFFVLIFILLAILVYMIVLDAGQKPNPLTYIWLAITTVHWVLFLSDLYSRLPEEILRYFWDMSWLILIGFGLYCALKEWKTNKKMSILLAIMSMGQLGFYLLLLLITSM
ncbi:hypothetical protein ACFO0S_14530 [Chryseomicrobium palamuruense]|uniref:Uncharacterized protein n=1 Tax=Chryseomicrobium palamuruense TaxID=682973 RepID=A0ABV8UYW7_9BACL